MSYCERTEVTDQRQRHDIGGGSKNKRPGYSQKSTLVEADADRNKIETLETGA